MSTNTRLYAFWQYDLPPFVLGDSGEMLPDGSFETDHYQMTLGRRRLLALYPLEMGASIMDSINAQTQLYREECANSLNVLHARTEAVLPELKRVK